MYNIYLGDATSLKYFHKPYLLKVYSANVTNLVINNYFKLIIALTLSNYIHVQKDHLNISQFIFIKDSECKVNNFDLYLCTLQRYCINADYLAPDAVQHNI